jgi:hypothetical protein
MPKHEPRYCKGDEIGGRYLVHEGLAGGMSEIYLCLVLQTNDPFALKTFRPQYLTNPTARTYFAREAGTLRRWPTTVRPSASTPTSPRPTPTAASPTWPSAGTPKH